jgi:hypothetical protein
LLWPWQDLQPDDLHFEAANMLAVRDIWRADPDSVFFQPQKVMTRRELAGVLSRLAQALSRKKDRADKPAAFTDVPSEDPDHDSIQSMLGLGNFGPQPSTFNPDEPVDWGTLHRWLKALDFAPDNSLNTKASALLPLTRSECVRHVWRVAKSL